jgi:hypothetical protein
MLGLLSLGAIFPTLCVAVFLAVPSSLLDSSSVHCSPFPFPENVPSRCDPSSPLLAESARVHADAAPAVSELYPYRVVMWRILQEFSPSHQPLLAPPLFRVWHPL